MMHEDDDGTVSNEDELDKDDRRLLADAQNNHAGYIFTRSLLDHAFVIEIDWLLFGSLRSHSGTQMRCVPASMQLRHD